MIDYPGGHAGLADRRRFWASFLGLSEAQVAWLPRQRRFERMLSRMAPGWARQRDSGGPYLGRVFKLDRGEALLRFNFLAVVLHSVGSPSCFTLTVDTGGDLEARLVDHEAAAVGLDDAWTARLVNHAAAFGRRKRDPLRRLWRRCRSRLGLGPPTLDGERLSEGLAKRRGWMPIGPDKGRKALFQGYAFADAKHAVLFANAAAGLLGHLWEDVEAQVSLSECNVIVILFAQLDAWPPRDLLEAADWVDDAAAQLGGVVVDLEPGAERGVGS